MAALDPLSGTLGRKAAAHLLRRATFGPTRQTIDQFAAMTADEAVNALLTSVTPPLDSELPWLVAQPIDGMDIDESMKTKQFLEWQLERMRSAGASSIEKIVFFLHTHFTTKKTVVEVHAALYNQNKLFRFYALGNIKALARKVCTDNAMLILLDGTLNVKGSPNENFAREFFELFTIGKGPLIDEGDYTNYTEADIQAAAKVLSGFGTDLHYLYPDKDTGIAGGIVKTSGGGSATGTAAASQHDASVKTFSQSSFGGAQIGPIAKSGNFATVDAAQDEVDQLVNMIFSKAETAKNICRKLYRFFVYYNITPAVETNVIGPLADTLVNSAYELKPVLEQLLKSQHFFDADNTEATDDARGAIIKSPLDLVMGILIYFNAQPKASPPEKPSQDYAGPYDYILNSLQDQGMDFYEPLDVSGYDGYAQPPFYSRNWISANYLANRYLFPKLLIDAGKTGGAYYGFYIDVLAFVKAAGNFSDPSSATKLVQEMVDYLLPEPITTDRYNYFKNTFLDNFTDMQWDFEWAQYGSTGNDAVVRNQLEILFWTVLKSPEYQLG